MVNSTSVSYIASIYYHYSLLLSIITSGFPIMYSFTSEISRAYSRKKNSFVLLLSPSPKKLIKFMKIHYTNKKIGLYKPIFLLLIIKIAAYNFSIISCMIILIIIPGFIKISLQNFRVYFTFVDNFTFKVYPTVFDYR